MGTLKSLKLKYLDNHLFKKNSAHGFEDHIRTNKLEECFFQKKIFQRLRAFFATTKPLVWASFFPQKNNFVVFFKCDYLILIQYLTHASNIYLEKVKKIADFTL